jgi:hypothetical protein
MNSKQQSKLKMYLTLRIYLLSNQAITARLPNFPEFLAALNAAIDQIQTNAEQHQYNTKGTTVNKKQLRESLIILAADNSSKMQAYARYINDLVLLAEIKYSRTSLRPISDFKLSEVAMSIYDRIDVNLEYVGSYTLTTESQKTFRDAIKSFSDLIPQPRQMQMKGKENSLLENQGFEIGDAAITNIDSVVEIVRLTEPVFYAGYKNAHKVINLGTNSLQVQGNVSDATTGQPIADATLLFSLSGQPEVILKKQTAAKGGFRVKSLAEGIYGVTVSKVGYQTQTVSVVVSSTELSEVGVKLMKI